MDKKVVLITGASSGMGYETAIKLLDLGCIVYGGARRIEKMKDFENCGGHSLLLDVTNEESMTKCVNQIIKLEGRIDVLVNNAGYGSCGSIEEIPMDEVRRQFEVNVFGLGRMTQLVLPYMRAQHSGRIVNIASMGGRFTSPFCGWYHSTKYAVESISDALSMEVKSFGIDVVVIEPGMIQTNWGVIAAQNIRKTSHTSDYQKSADIVAKYYEDRYVNKKHGLTDPKNIAKTICKAILTKRPKLRYLVGKNAKLFILLKSILTDRIYQASTKSFMGL